MGASRAFHYRQERVHLYGSMIVPLAEFSSLGFSVSGILRGPCAYGQSRGVMPFSCAYFAADASTRGRTSA
jgi:hypothetical protein